MIYPVNSIIYPSNTSDQNFLIPSNVTRCGEGGRRGGEGEGIWPPCYSYHLLQVPLLFLPLMESPPPPPLPHYSRVSPFPLVLTRYREYIYKKYALWLVQPSRKKAALSNSLRSKNVFPKVYLSKSFTNCGS